MKLIDFITSRQKNINILVLLGLFSLIFFVAGFNTIKPEDIEITLLSKKAITTEEFKIKMEARGYDVQDKSSLFSQYNYVKEVYFAISNENEYQIQFYQFSDKNHAKNFFNKNESIFRHYKSFNYNLESIVNFSNYTVYALNSNGLYRLVSRIDNTAIYLVVDSKYSAEANQALYELGYAENFNSYFDNPYFMTFCMIFWLVILASLWKLFVKAGESWWGSLIPFYNLYLLAKITYGSGWKVLWLLIPGVNVICLILGFFKLAKVYGKSILFGFGLWFLFPIFLPILAFGKSQFLKNDVFSENLEKVEPTSNLKLKHHKDKIILVVNIFFVFCLISILIDGADKQALLGLAIIYVGFLNLVYIYKLIRKYINLYINKTNI